MNTKQIVDKVFEEVEAERARGVAKHGTMTNAYQAHSVILKEYEDLWALIRTHNGLLGPARRQAIRLAAVAVSYAADVCDPFRQELMQALEAPINVEAAQITPPPALTCYYCKKRPANSKIDAGLCTYCEPF